MYLRYLFLLSLFASLEKIPRILKFLNTDKIKKSFSNFLRFLFKYFFVKQLNISSFKLFDVLSLTSSINEARS